MHNSADIYGASRSLLRLLPEVRKRGIEARVVLPEHGPLEEKVRSLGIEVIVDRWLTVIDRNRFRSIRLFGLGLGFPVSVWRLVRVIRRHRIRLVHTNTGVMPAPALAARIAGVPHVWHIRDSFIEFRALWRFYRRYITGLSSRVVTVSRAIAAQFDEAPNVEVIHNGMPISEFPERTESMRREFRDRYALGEGFVVGCVGRIKLVRKGQEILIQAAARLRERGIRAKYLVVGSPFRGNEDHLIRLKQLIRDLGLVEDVVFTGELADVRPAYAAMDVLVLPSAQPEPFGGVVLEAMGMGRPVVATAIGGSLDQVDEGRTGFLVPPGDASALAERLAVLLTDDGLRLKMGEAGRERLVHCFSIEQMIGKLDAAYRKAQGEN